MAITHDVIATNGEYTTKDGEAKTRFHKCGIAMLNKKGETSIFLESLPTNFNGWLTLKVPKAKGENNSAPQAQEPEAGFDSMEDDIPF